MIILLVSYKPMTELVSEWNASIWWLHTAQTVYCKAELREL